METTPDNDDSVLKEGIEQASQSECAFLRKWENLFLSSDDIAWEDWVNHKNREGRDLRNLLKENVRDSIKARALYLLLVYDRSHGKSIYWNRKLYPLFGEFTFPENLSPELLNFSADMIVEFLPKIGNLRDPSDSHAFYFYCNAMINLMTLLDLEESKKLLEHFPLNDYQNVTGCKPFGMLLNDKMIPDELKSIATDSMIEIIRSEKRRGYYKEAIGCFASTIQLNLHSRELIPYGTDLFARQIDFLISQKAKKKIIDDFNVETILSIFDNEEYATFRKRFIRFVILEDGDRKYNINDESKLNSAKNMFKEVKNSRDRKLIKALEKIISEGEIYVSRESMQKNNGQNLEQKLLKEMS